MHAQNDGGNADLPGGDLVCRLDAVQIRHGDIEHSDVGPGRFGQIHRSTAVAGLADHLEIFLLLEHQAESAADDGVIVGQDNPNHAALSVTGLQGLSASWKYVERTVP